MTKLAVIVHENNEITVRDGRGVGVSCHECRFSGWKSDYSWRNHPIPPRCLWHSGGRDPVDGDRVLDSVSLGTSDYQWDSDYKLGKLYPRCKDRNHDGACEKFVRAKPLPWWNPLRWLGREHRTRKYRE